MKKTIAFLALTSLTLATSVKKTNHTQPIQEVVFDSFPVSNDLLDFFDPQSDFFGTDPVFSVKVSQKDKDNNQKDLYNYEAPKSNVTKQVSTEPIEIVPIIPKQKTDEKKKSFRPTQIHGRYIKDTHASNHLFSLGALINEGFEDNESKVNVEAERKAFRSALLP